MPLPICLITGVGDATGAALTRRFAAAGYRVAMIARNRQRLLSLEQEIPKSKAFPCDISDLQALQHVLESVFEEMGHPEVVIHNAVSHTFDTFLNGDPADLERNFRVNTTALLYIARAVADVMISRKSGSIIVTGNTAALRGVPKYALFAPTKAAQRILAQSLARDLGPRGIHVAYVTIDAAIDVTWLDPEKDDAPWLMPPSDWPHPREDFYAKPTAIAEEVFHLSQQDRSTWAFDLVVRPFAERW